jgi:hypothetical protein
MIDDDTAAAIQQRCSAAAARLHGGGAVDLVAVADDLQRLPPESPVRAVLAASLVAGAVRRPGHDAEGIRGLERILPIAERHPPDWPTWPGTVSLARVLVQALAGSDHGAYDAHAMVAEFDDIVARAGDAPQAALLRAMGEAPALLAAVQDRDHAAMLRAVDEFRRLRDEHGAESPLGLMFDAMAENAALLMAHERGDAAERRRAFERLSAAAARLPPGHPMRTAVEERLHLAEPLLGVSDDGELSIPDGYLPALEAFAEREDISAGTRRFYRSAAGILRLQSDDGLDRAGIDAIVEDLRQAATGAPPGDPQRPHALVTLGLALLRRSELLGGRADLQEAERWLTEAREGASGPGDPIWAMAVEGLALVERGQGHAGGARRLDLEQLRRHAWSVLLQSDVRAATVAAREAAAEAVSSARACLADNVPGDAVRALDAGRGLVLFAATELRDVAGRLAAAGHDELAGRWRAATTAAEGTIPAPLRRAVVEALSDDAGGRLLDPPRIGEIRGALRAQDTDALVYLVTGDGVRPGAAVMVPAYGPPSFMALPNLLTDGDPDVERYLRAVAARDDTDSAPRRGDREMTPQPAGDGLDACLDRLCDWMWKAAMGPLLERYAGRELRPVPGRVHRLVLVTMGELAQLPWAAARRGDGMRAVHLVALSQTPSARLLCENAARPPVPPSPTGLVVGDPDTGHPGYDLPAARLEADAVRRAFYPGARYIGRRPDGTPSRSGIGSGGEVRAWLADTDPAAGAMLHLACHGIVNTGGDETSYLLLAGGDRLSAEELVALMARTPQRDLGLVVLAGCRTGTTTRGYDEAYSLGTAFLAGGARSVLSTQWNVDDRATSILMYLFHHNLVLGRWPVRDALRQAQLWMLDPHRRPLPAMPPRLREGLEEHDLTAVRAWAGFVHWGQ